VAPPGPAPRQLGFLYDFITKLPLGRLEPFDGITAAAGSGAPGRSGTEAGPAAPDGSASASRPGEALALAVPGETYVVYLPHGGQATLDLSHAAGDLNVQWFNPRSGESGTRLTVPGGRPWHFTAPDGEDWVVRLDAASTA
jgi:hypothetical protein